MQLTHENTWCFLYLFLQSMICQNQIEETILTCEFVSNFVARYWYKMVATPFSRHRIWFCKAILQNIHSASILKSCWKWHKLITFLRFFSTVIREIEDLIHNWKVFSKVINKNCLYFINKICTLVVIIRDDTKRIVSNIPSSSVKYTTSGCSEQYSLLQW